MTDAMSSPQATMAMLEEQTRRNMELFGQTMRMFTPFQAGSMPGAGASPDTATDDKAPAGKPEDLSALREELDGLRAKMDELLDKK